MLDEFLLQLKSTQARHANVEHKASRALLGDNVEKLVCGAEYFVPEVDRVHQRLHREANGRIVINDENRWYLFRCRGHRRRLDQNVRRFANAVV